MVGCQGHMLARLTAALLPGQSSTSVWAAQGHTTGGGSDHDVQMRSCATCRMGSRKLLDADGNAPGEPVMSSTHLDWMHSLVQVIGYDKPHSCCCLPTASPSLIHPGYISLSFPKSHPSRVHLPQLPHLLAASPCRLDASCSRVPTSAPRLHLPSWHSLQLLLLPLQLLRGIDCMAEAMARNPVNVVEQRLVNPLLLDHNRLSSAASRGSPIRWR